MVFHPSSFGGEVLLQFCSVVFAAFCLLAKKRNVVKKFLRCAEAYWNQGPFTVPKHRIRFDQASMTGKDHLRRRRIVAHPHTLQHACDDTHQFLLSEGSIKVGMRTCQRFALEYLFDDFARLRDLASLHPLTDKSMQFRQKRSIFGHKLVPSTVNRRKWYGLQKDDQPFRGSQDHPPNLGIVKAFVLPLFGVSKCDHKKWCEKQAQGVRHGTSSWNRTAKECRTTLPPGAINDENQAQVRASGLCVGSGQLIFVLDAGAPLAGEKVGGYVARQQLLLRQQARIFERLEIRQVAQRGEAEL